MDEMNSFVEKLKNLERSDLMAETITPFDLLKSDDSMKCKMELFVSYIQALVMRKLQLYEKTKRFVVDRWLRKEGGGGITIVLQNGDVFEKAAVNISVVFGVMQKEQMNSIKSRGKDLKMEGVNTFFATGVSCVLHAHNPFIPSMHFNYRYFEVLNECGHHNWWFGGGTDLTPTYLDEEDVVHFHQTQKDACDKHNRSYYPKFKKWADDYFYNKHRGETRGVGGIFFDDLTEGGIDECFQFLITCGHAVLPAYIPLVDKNKDRPYTTQQKEWQLVRKGRYVEFNLVYDRGTRFGLATPGSRIESILVSMPLVARWEYMFEIKDGSEEAKISELLKNPRDWVA